MKLLYLLVCCLLCQSNGDEDALDLEEEDPFLERLLHSPNTTTNGNETGPDYHLKQATDNFGSMGTLYKMSRKFADAVAPKEPIVDELLEYLSGNKTVDTDGALRILKTESGFMACLVLGLLMFFGLGIAGTCFCCCRCCCGKCGGDRIATKGDDSTTSRHVYFFLLFLTQLLIIVAVGCGYMVSGSFGDAILDSEETTIHVLDDISMFFNTTSSGLEKLAIGGVEETIQEIKDSLNGLDAKIGVPLQEETVKELETVKTFISAIDIQLHALKKAEEKLESSVTGPTKKITTELAAVKDKLKEIKSDCGAPCARLEENPVEPPDVNADKLPVLPASIGKILNKETDGIPQKVKDTTAKAVEDALKKIDDFVETFKKGDVQKSINESSEVTKFVPDTKKDVKDLYEDLRKYEPYWYYGMVGAISLVSIPVFLICLGMCCGCVGHRKSRHPAERGGLSNCGGCTIITGVYLLFFLTGIPILIMILTFQVGGHVEAHLCKVVYQEELSTFDKIFDFLKTKMSLSGDMLKELSPSQTFKKCENDTTIYEALNLESVFNLEGVLDKIVDDLKLGDKLSNLEVNIEMGDIFDKTKEIHSFDQSQFDDLKKELKRPFSYADYDKWIQNLEGFTTQDTTGRLQEQVTKLQELRDNEIKKVEEGKTDALEILKDVDPPKFKKQATDLDEGVRKVLEAIENKAKEMKTDFVNKLEGTFKKFVTEAKYKVKNDIGRCKPVWVIFDVSRHLVCRDFLYPMNAYWFCLGWALFFSIFAIAFGTKLSRHYFRMSDTRAKWNDDDLEPREYITASTERRPCIPMRESGMNYNNQGYHSPPPYAVPPPHYSYGPPHNPYDDRSGAYRKY